MPLSNLWDCWLLDPSIFTKYVKLQLYARAQKSHTLTMNRVQTRSILITKTNSITFFFELLHSLCPNSINQIIFQFTSNKKFQFLFLLVVHFSDPLFPVINSFILKSRVFKTLKNFFVKCCSKPWLKEKKKKFLLRKKQMGKHPNSCGLSFGMYMSSSDDTVSWYRKHFWVCIQRSWCLDLQELSTLTCSLHYTQETRRGNNSNVHGWTRG